MSHVWIVFWVGVRQCTLYFDALQTGKMQLVHARNPLSHYASRSADSTKITGKYALRGFEMFEIVLFYFFTSNGGGFKKINK